MRTGANAGQDRRNGPAVVGSHMALMLIAHPCGSGRSPISGFVCALELRELPKTVFGGNRGHRGGICVSSPEGSMSQVHPPQPKISDRAHAELLLAAQAQCAFGYADRGTNLAKVKRIVGVLREHLFETGEDCPVTPAQTSRGLSVVGHAGDH